MKRKRQPKPEKGGNPVWQKTQYANLLRYVPSGVYFARFRCGGKLVWKSLKTDRISVAQLRLNDEISAARKQAESGKRLTKATKVLFGDLLREYRSNGWRPCKARTPKDAARLKPAGIRYYEQSADRLYRLWPDIAKTEVRSITEGVLKSKLKPLRAEMGPSTFNHTLGIIRNAMDYGVHIGAIHSNAAMAIVREREPLPAIEIPSGDEFAALVQAIERSGSGWSKPCADLVRFLAYGGFRKGEAANIVWGDCDFQAGLITVRGDPVTGLKNRQPGQTRIVPMIPVMRRLLERLREERPDDAPTARVMRVSECDRAMKRAAQEIGIKPIRHHDFRHLFATTCIESGVDIPTVSRWLGHKDGGALAMRVYGHLRDKHSQAMARKVTFDQAENVISMPEHMEARQ